MQKPIKSLQQGYSIIELMVAISITLIIGAVIATYVMSYLSDSRVTQTQAKMVLLSADLDSYWRFKQTFTGYSQNDIKVPQDDSLIHYNINIYDKDTGGSLANTEAIGKHYAIIATPSVSNMPAFYIDDQGNKCSSAAAKAVTVTGCGDKSFSGW